MIVTSACLTGIRSIDVRQRQLAPGPDDVMVKTHAAGICGQAEGEVVTMTIRPDVPDPRCLSVTSTQRLRVVNSRGEPITVTLFTQTASIAVGGSIWLQAP